MLDVLRNGNGKAVAEVYWKPDNYFLIVLVFKKLSQELALLCTRPHSNIQLRQFCSQNFQNLNMTQEPTDEYRQTTGNKKTQQGNEHQLLLLYICRMLN